MTEYQSLPVSPKYLCPYLGVRFDADTYSADGGRPNYCHKANPTAPVNIEHQVGVCTAPDYVNCPLYTSTDQHHLPPIWLNETVVHERKKINWASTLMYVAVGLAVLVLFVMIYQSGLVSFFSAAQVLQPPQASSTPVNTPLPSGTPVFTPILRPTVATLRAPTLPYSVTQTQQAMQLAETAAASASQTAQATPTVTLTLTPGTPTSSDPCEGDWANQLTLQLVSTEFSPKVFVPPLIIPLGLQPLLIKWKVTNTSSVCTWNLIQLVTESQVLNIMQIPRDQPIPDIEFALRDSQNYLINRVNPGQTVTVVIQINGLNLVATKGKLDKTCSLLINGHLPTSGTLTANIDQWVTVLVYTSTPTSLPTHAPPGSRTNTPAPVDTQAPTQTPITPPPPTDIPSPTQTPVTPTPGRP